MTARPRTRLGPLLLGAMLVAAAAVAAAAVAAISASATDRSVSDRTVATFPTAQTGTPRHEVRATLEANEPTATAALTTRTDDGPRMPSGRALAVLFAAAIALAALTAIRRASSTPTILRQPLMFEVRRRGPPLFIGS